MHISLVTSPVPKLIVALTALLLAISLVGCSTSAALKEDIVRGPMSSAQPPATDGLLAEVASDLGKQHGEKYSGFHILDGSRDGLYWRLALIDSATTSIDVQTYLWYPDFSGKLLLERVVLAAQRGVKVRLIVDDLILHGHDQFIVNMHAQPNIEFRIFNPWEDRGSMVDRAGEMLAQMERLNARMHDKLMIVDGRAAVVGGRNIGDHYFGLSQTYNFHDTDLLGIGHIALQANDMFDHFWNSKWVVSADNLNTEPDQAVAQQQWKNLQENSNTAAELESFSREPKDWTMELNALAGQLRPGRSKLIYDETTDDQIDQSTMSSMFNFFGIAKEELFIMNAYVIPSQPAVDFIQGLNERGVDVRIITNSLSSHDVPAVNSHWEPWRDDFIAAGVELFEFRSDPAIQKTIIDVPPVQAGFSGLHSKSAVADGRYVFIGSMNLDPRSANINTEMGAFVDSPELAEDMRQIILRDMDGDNAWHVQLDENDDLFWESSAGVLTKQPARSGMQRVMNVLMKVGPKEQY